MRPRHHSPCRRVRAALVSLVLACALGPLGCESDPQPPPIDNVVVVVIDALRADHLGCYGYERDTSPNMDALAARGTLFRQAVSPSPWTLPAMATLWTSLYPSVHGATKQSNLGQWAADPESFRPASVLDESHLTLAEILRRAGFATAAFVDGSYPGTSFGFGQGFDRFVEEEAKGLRLNVEAMFAWLDREAPERFFAYLHSIGVHSPYHRPIIPKRYLGARDERARYVRRVFREERKRYESLHFDPKYQGELKGDRATLDAIARGQRELTRRDLEHLVALYDTGIAYDDYWVGQLLQRLRERNLDDRTLIIVTSDHGDEFLDHGGWEHSRTYYDEMLRVPLILRAPGHPGGRRIDRQVGLIDVAPTVIDLVGVESDVPRQGRSLRPLIAGDDLPARTMYAEASMARHLKAAARTEKLKFILTGPERPNELYDRASDPAERSNLCEESPQRCTEWRRRLKGWRREMRELRANLELPAPRSAELDAATRDRLRALGYAQ